MGASGAGVTSLASAGLSAYADITKAEAVAGADEYQANRLDLAAKYGELKAVQTSGQMTRNLNTVLGNIDAVRAAAGADPNSPTGAIVRDTEEQIGAEQRGITVASILQQGRQQTADAAYYRQAAGTALKIGAISAGGDLLKGASGSGIFGS